MNTGLLFPALFAADGGIERILRLYLRAAGELSHLPHQVHLVVLNDRHLTAEQLAPFAGRTLTPPVACGRHKLACLWHTIRMGRRSNRLICGHVNLLRLAHLARRFSPGLEVWLVAHGIEVWRPFNPAERRALRATNRILCVSDYTRRQLVAGCPDLSSTQLLVQPNALDPQFAWSTPRTVAPVAGLILSVARLSAAEDYKGVNHLIAAMPAVRRAVPAARLRIIGDGDDRPRLEALAAPTRDAVDFQGRVSDEELRQQLDSCQLFALPSRNEGFGLVYLEALARGKPCIAADAGGAPEVIDSSCGALVRYGDVPALADACVAALRCVWDPAKLRARAAEFSYDVFYRRLAAVW